MKERKGFFFNYRFYFLIIKKGKEFGGSLTLWMSCKVAKPDSKRYD